MIKVVICLILFLCISVAAGSGKSHGLALYGKESLKYKEGEPYDFTNPHAPKGGTLNFSRMGSFTKLNPFSLKGTSAPGIWLSFESLGTRSLDTDEPYSIYGELAQYMELAPDKSSIVFYLHPKAHFSDGTPVTADDVVFSFNLIQDPGFNPNSRMLYQDVGSVEKIDNRTVRFTFKKYTRKLPLLVAQLSVLPRHIYGVEGKLFGKDFDDVKPVGSGPYLLDKYDHSSFVVMKRDKNWWGKDLPLNRGLFNFDTIKYHIYQSAKSILLALKGGTVDLKQINSSSDWHNEFNGDNIKKGYLKKKNFQTKRVAGMQCFVFNLRKPVFQDIRVRKAIASVMDFEFMNKNLFYGQYKRSICCWDNKPEMMSRGPAKGKVREELVRLFKKHNKPKEGKIFVPKEAILLGPTEVGRSVDGKMQSIEDRILAARKYLNDSGWIYDHETQVRKKDGIPLRFQFLVVGKGFSRIIQPYIEQLREIGVDATLQNAQPAEFIKRRKMFDYDVIVGHLGGSECPGSELNMAYHSSTARTRGSYNFLGLQNPAVDEILEMIINAKSRKEVVNYVKVLDRIICANHYAVPQWYISSDRSIYWNKFSGPKGYSEKTGFEGNVLNFWWYDKDKAERLNTLRAAGQQMKQE